MASVDIPEHFKFIKVGEVYKCTTELYAWSPEDCEGLEPVDIFTTDTFMIVSEVYKNERYLRQWNFDILFGDRLLFLSFEEDETIPDYFVRIT